MEEIQAEIAEHSETGTAANGAISLTLSGDKTMTDIKINPDVVDADDIEMLEDMIRTAHNDATSKMEAFSKEKMKAMPKLPGGMGLPF